MTELAFDAHSDAADLLDRGRTATPARKTGRPVPGRSDGPLRILHVLRGPIGGLLRHVTDLAREQARQGHVVGIVCAANGTGPRAEQLLAGIEPFCALGLTRLRMSRRPGLTDWRIMHAISAHAQALAPDVIHAHGAKGGVYARLPKLWGVCPDAIRVYTPHGGSFHFGPGTRGHRLVMAVERGLARLTDAFAFESGYVENLFRTYVGTTEALVTVAPNGLYPSEFEPVRHDGPTAADFMYLGEMRWMKGLDTLLEASALVRSRRGIEPRLALVGSGPHLDAIRAHAERLGLREATFLPPRPAREAFGLAPVMVLPSRVESLPYVVIEAVAAQIDLIATRVGGIPEIVGPPAERLLPPDDPAVLARAMEAALDETPEVRGARARHAAAALSSSMRIEHMVGSIMSTYRHALARKQDAHVLSQ